VVTLHAALKQIEDVAVVGVSSETEAAAVLHEFFEFSRLVQAELVYGDLFLFSPDVIIFLVL
jgi:acid stress-induced BolA-like protein IbaG/YrbA